MTEQELRTEIADEYGEDSAVYRTLVDVIDERDHYRQLEPELRREIQQLKRELEDRPDSGGMARLHASEAVVRVAREIVSDKGLRLTIAQWQKLAAALSALDSNEV